MLLSAFSTSNIQDDKWHLAKNRNDIKVYTRSVESFVLKEFKGETNIQASIEKILIIIKDLDAYTEWMPGCTESKLLKKISDNEYYHYAVRAAPWPLSDRDAITHIKIEPNTNGNVMISVAAKPNFIAEKPNMVRVPFVRASWQLTPQTDGSTNIIYIGIGSAGGNIPDWLANTAVVTVPYGTLYNLKKALF
ncbi:MAG: START domain-containing protein [Chitinophagales bacterium]